MIVGPDVSDVGRHLRLHRHPGQPEISRADVQHLIEEPAEAHALALQRTLAAEGEEALHDAAGAIDRSLHHDQVRLHRFRRFVGQELHASLQHRERVVELVRDAGHQLAQRRELGRLDHLLLGQRQSELLILDHLVELPRRVLRLLEEARVVHRVRRVRHERVEEL